MASVVIDVSFDFRADAAGQDPDASSPTLLRYHHLLQEDPGASAEAAQLEEPGAFCGTLDVLVIPAPNAD